MNLQTLKQKCIEQNIPLIQDEMGEFLNQTIKKYKPMSIFEIGTAIGYSGFLMLAEMSKYNLATKKLNSATSHISLISCDVDESRIKQAKENLKDFNAKIICESATTFIKKLEKENKKFDLIFLDGPKAQYKNYLNSLINLLNIGGILIADNVFFHGLVDLPIVKTTKDYDEEKFNNRSKDVRELTTKLKDFLLMCLNDVRLETQTIAKADGILFAKKVKN